MQNNWGNFSKVAFFAICEIFSQFKGGTHGPSGTGPMVNTPLRDPTVL